jgi:hypothetical protein
MQYKAKSRVHGWRVEHKACRIPVRGEMVVGGVEVGARGGGKGVWLL